MHICGPQPHTAALRDPPWYPHNDMDYTFRVCSAFDANEMVLVLPVLDAWVKAASPELGSFSGRPTHTDVYVSGTFTTKMNTIDGEGLLSCTRPQACIIEPAYAKPKAFLRTMTSEPLSLKA